MSKSHPRADGKSRPAEMRRNDTHRNPAGTGAKRFQNADGAGDSSSPGRSTKTGTTKQTTRSGGRITGGGSSGASSNTEGTR